MFTLSPTFPVTLRFTFSSKSNAVVLRLRWGSEGLSTFFLVTPNFSSAVPWVFTLTPPGPNIFSAGPRSKCMSEKSNFSLPFLSNSSAFFVLKKSASAFFSLHWRYSSGVIITGALRYESPIFEPTRYTLSESLYTTSCLIFSGSVRSSGLRLRSPCSSGAVFCIFHRAFSSESGISSSSIMTGCSLTTPFWAVLSSCGGTASAHTLRNTPRAIDSLCFT